MDSESGLMDRYFRNASPQRLILYGVIAVGIIVAIILVFTLLLSSDKTENVTPKPEEFVGHSVLKNVPLVDGYNNLPVNLVAQLKGKINDFGFDKDLSKTEAYKWVKTDIPRLRAGMLGCQIWTAKSACDSQYKDAVALTLQQIDATLRLIRKYPSDLKLAYSSHDVNDIFKENKVGSILAIDGGHSIDNKLSTLRTYYNLGVRYVTLTSECDTPWSASFMNADKPAKGLSTFGEAVIKEMNRIGMVIDISQSNVETQQKVLEISKAPVIFSSSNMYSIYGKVPNVQDVILDKLKKNNGLIMISFNPETIQQDASTVAIEQVIAQINYVRNKVGIDNVGIGAGFGRTDKVVKQLEDSSTYPLLFDQLAKSKDPKWGKEELEKLAGLNFLRVLQDVEKASQASQPAVEDLIPATDISTENQKCYTALQLYTKPANGG